MVQTKKRKVPPQDELTDSDDSDREVNPDLAKEDDGPLGFGISNIPKRPHPKTELLDELSFEVLPENFFVIVYGARRTGKTHAVTCLLEEIKDRFDFAYLFSATAGLHKGEQGELDFEMIRDEAKFEGFDEDALLRIIARQKAVKEHNNKTTRKSEKKPNRTLLIFDDFVHDKKVRYSKTFTELPVLGRHYGLSVICLSQGYSAVGSSGLNPATRQNSDLVITFFPRNIADVERIAGWYISGPKLDAMWFIRSVCEKEHRCMAIDLTKPHLTEYEDYVYSSVSPADVPKYELGKVQWKLYHEERKRQKKAALAAKVENDRYLMMGPTAIEKQAKVGQATGLPENRTKMSLYDATRHFT